MTMLDEKWVQFWSIFEKVVKSTISGTWLFDFHTPEGLAKGLVLCTIANSELSKILESFKFLLKPSETLLDLLVPDDTCFGTSWYTKKEEKFKRIKSLKVPRAYEDELSGTQDILSAPTALLEVKQALEMKKGVTTCWNPF